MGAGEANLTDSQQGTWQVSDGVEAVATVLPLLSYKATVYPVGLAAARKNRMADTAPEDEDLNWTPSVTGAVSLVTAGVWGNASPKIVWLADEEGETLMVRGAEAPIRPTRTRGSQSGLFGVIGCHPFPGSTDPNPLAEVGCVAELLRLVGRVPVPVRACLLL